tara:strand:- start:574 stop:1368 length:795 start_codon:yes stop_codon:yes gene_type:complete
MTTVALSLEDVSLVRDGKFLLENINLKIREGERWVIFGPNGSGKTSLLRVASFYTHPTNGKVEVLGYQLGKTDIRKMRHLVGFSSQGFADLLRPSLTALEVVMTAAYGALEPWWHKYSEEDKDKALLELKRIGIESLRDQTFGTLSSGERQRVLIARSMMSDPGLLLLDEPAAGLDLPARENLVNGLSLLSKDASAPPIALVTHHVEEIPAGFTHVLFLRGGKAIAAGAINETLNENNLSACFELDLRLQHRNGRWSATAEPER